MLHEEFTEDKHRSKYKYKMWGVPARMVPINAKPGAELQGRHVMQQWSQQD